MSYLIPTYTISLSLVTVFTDASMNTSPCRSLWTPVCKVLQTKFLDVYKCWAKACTHPGSRNKGTVSTGWGSGSHPFLLHASMPHAGPP